MIYNRKYVFCFEHLFEYKSIIIVRKVLPQVFRNPTFFKTVMSKKGMIIVQCLYKLSMYTSGQLNKKVIKSNKE